MLTTNGARHQAHDGDRAKDTSEDAARAAFPLSHQQRSLWFIQKVEPQSAAYNVAVPARFGAGLDGAALRRALLWVIARHPQLRTLYRDAGGEPEQYVLDDPELALAFREHGAAESPEADLPEAELERRVQQRYAEPFELSSGPVVRVDLFWRTNGCVLLLVVHHINLDGGSLQILLGELGAAYAACAAGASPLLPEQPNTYRGFVSSQREFLSSPAGSELSERWRARLRDGLPSVELPYGNTGDGQSSGESRAFRIEPALAEALAARLRTLRCSMFAALLAAFGVLITRYVRQRRLVIGAPVAGRTRAECDGVVGHFANLLPIPLDLGADRTIESLLDDVAGRAYEAIEDQDYPFERIGSNRQRASGADPTSALQLVLDYLGTRGGEQALWTTSTLGEARPLHIGPLQGVTFPLRQQEGKFDLQLEVLHDQDGLHCVWKYRSLLLPAPFVERMTGHLMRVLEAFAGDVTQRVSQIEILSESERAELLGSVAHAERPTRSLQAAFEACAAAHPDDIAVVCGLDSLSYAELDARANGLASRLRALGVRRDTRVALYMQRSVELVVGLFGILKAGAGYVPLDAALPKGRLEFVLRDAAPSAVVTQRALLAGLPAVCSSELGLPILSVDDGALEPNAIAPAEASGPHDLAYVIYTSGSTGTPKGVAVEHRSVMALFEATRESFQIGRGDVWTLFHSPGFDFSVWEIFGALCHGGTLVVVGEEETHDPAAFHALLSRERVTVLNQTPSAFRALDRHDASGAGGKLSLRLVIFGGEALDPSTLRGWVQRHGDDAPRLVNMYGITETCVHVTERRIRAADTRRPASSPIGRPLPHLYAWVLDPDRRLSPKGCVGELWVGGAGVARGYLNRPELTEQRFVEDPLRAGGSRLYRSGDLVRRCEDGELEYLGRIDQQVKIRGFRIELGEIEAALRDGGVVEDAAVRVLTDAEGQASLVAYVVPRGPRASLAELRDRVKQQLPYYMVPSHLLAVASLPLTHNGKRDLDRLPLPSAGGDGALQSDTARSDTPRSAAPHAAERDSDAPRTDTERRIAAIWCEVLRRESVGRSDDFFAIGGQSLLATSAVIRVRAALGVELPILSLFRNPRLEAFARSVDDAERAESSAAIPSGAGTDKLPLSFSQRGLWFMHDLSRGSGTYNVAVVMRVRGALDRSALARALRQIQERHGILRSVIVSDAGGPQARVGTGEAFWLRCASFAHLPEAERDGQALQAVARDTQQPFELERGPVWRALLAEVSAEEHLLAISAHHIVFDGWSTGILLAELEAGYAAFGAGEEPRLRPLSHQYWDIAAWQQASWNTVSARRSLDASLDYWRSRFATLPPPIDLPFAKRRPEAQSFRGASIAVDVGPETSRALRAFAAARSVTPFTVLLAAFKALLFRYTGEADLAIGAPVAGRRRAEAEPLIGCFVNTLVLRTSLDGSESFAGLCARVHETVLGGLEHQDVPLEVLVEQLAPPRRADRNPLFQVAFAFQNSREHVPRLGAGPVELLTPESAAARFDITFGLNERADRFSGYIEFATDLFEARSIERLFEHFRTLLAACLAEPSLPIAKAPWLTADERERVLYAWNATAVDYGLPEPVCLLVEAVASRTPHVTALSFRGATRTYAELVARAQGIARRLQRRGVRPGRAVGVLLERGFDLPASLLAIQACGAVYLPLDRGYPAERLRFICRDAEPAVVISERRRVDLLGEGVPWLALDEDGEEARASEAESASSPDTRSSFDPDSAAYTIYTSGSTGRPKGVTCSHRGLHNRLVWMQHRYGLTSAERYLHKTSIGFDVSLWELCMPLITGAVLHLAEPGRHADPEYLIAEIEREGLTLSHFVPAMLREFLAAPGAARCTSLSRVFCSGEALTRDLEERFLATLDAELHNLYGPTEASIEVTEFACDGAPERRHVPIGKPIANTQIYVLDAGLEPVPVGVPGELCIGGVPVALGYLGRPELSEQRFVPNPFAPGRIYRTGDRAAWSEQGMIDYLGRSDDQLKIRGHRVELGEIEQVLLEHPELGHAAVVAREGAHGVQLVAFVTARAGARLESSPLRAYLAERLPMVMVPSLFVTVDALPATASGKVDRKALLLLERPALGDGAGAPPAHAGVERELGLLWSELLGIDTPCFDANFFDAGGHSYLLIRLRNRIEERFGARLELLDLFRCPTLRGQAALLDGRAPAAPEHSGQARAQARRARSRAAALRRGEPTAEGEG